MTQGAWRSVVLPGVLLGGLVLGGIELVRYHKEGSVVGVASVKAGTSKIESRYLMPQGVSKRSEGRPAATPTATASERTAVPVWLRIKPEAGKTIGIGIGGAALIGLIIALARRAKTQPPPQGRRSASPYYNPKEFRSERPMRSRVMRYEDPHMKLWRACQGDADVIARLIQHERSRAPTISDGEAAGRALERLARDRL